MIEIIAARPEHHAFILATWLRSYRNSLYPHPGERSMLPIPSSDAVFKTLQDKIKAGWSDEGDFSTLVAVNASDHDQLLGWICGGGGNYASGAEFVHWVYVKDAFRRMGLGLMLWKALGGPREYTMHTKNYYKFRELNLTFNPFLL